MNALDGKTPQDSSKSINNDAGKKKISNGSQQFEDNRSKIIAQRKVQESADDSLQSHRTAQLQTVMHESDQGQQVAQLQDIIGNRKVGAIQLKSNFESEKPQERENIIQQKPVANNTGLPDKLKTGIENLSGHSMDDVKVHYNSEKPAQLQAHAYAQGSNIHIGPGQEKHLPHEAWHVIQQKQGRVKPTLRLHEKVNINDDIRMEREADVQGAKALSSFSSDTAIQAMSDSSVSSSLVNSNNSVLQLKDYGDKFKNEKSKILKKLQELNLAGISSGGADSFTWHHKYPHSKFKVSEHSNLKDARNYLALGPNPEARVKGDDPGNDGVDLNYQPTSDEVKEPLTPRISRKLKVEHDKFGFDDLLLDGIAKSPELQEQGNERKEVSLEEVSQEWSQWFIPEDYIKEIGTEAELRDKCKESELRKLLNEKENSPSKVGNVFKEISDRIQAALTSLLHEYVVFVRPKSGGKKFKSEDDHGVPVTNLTPENLGSLHGILDMLLNGRNNWLRRGSMGEALDEERQLLSLVDQKKFSEENIQKVRDKFNAQEALGLIERTRIAPDSFSKIVDLYEDNGLQDELGAYTGANPIAKPEDIGKLLIDKKEFENLEKSLIRQIEEMVRSEDDFLLLSWCAQYLPDEDNDIEPGEAVEGLKVFIEEYKEKKEAGPEIEEEEVQDIKKQPKLSKKEAKKQREKDKKKAKEERGKKKREDAKAARNKGNKGRQDSDDDSDDELIEEYIPDLESLLDEHDDVANLFGTDSEGYEEDLWQKISFLLSKKGRLNLPEEIVTYLEDEEDAEDGSFNPKKINAWEPTEIMVPVPEDKAKYRDEEELKYEIAKFSHFFEFDDLADWDIIQIQQELGDFDLLGDYDEFGLDENISGMLAYKAHLIDMLINNPRDILKDKEKQKELAGLIIEDIKEKLQKRKERWSERLKSSAEKVNEHYLQAKIKDLMFDIKPMRGELEEDFMKRVQDEVSLSLVSHLEAQDQEAFELGIGKVKAGSNKASAELIAYIDDVLPSGRVMQQGKVEMSREEVTTHLITYIDPIGESFNMKLWKDVRGQFLAQLDEDTIAQFREVEIDIENDPKKYLALEKKEKQSAKKKAPLEEIVQVVQTSYEQLAGLINETDNPGGGDCLFYALSNSRDREVSTILRGQIAEANNNISRHELSSLLNETPGLSRFAYRVPDSSVSEEVFNTDEVYERIISTQGTWGGRREILTYSGMGDGHQVAVVELEGGGVESVTVYDGGAAGQVQRFPNLVALRAALTGSEIIVHRGGNHWVRGALK